MCCHDHVFSKPTWCVYSCRAGYGLAHYTSINPASVGQEDALLVLQEFLDKLDPSAGYVVSIKQICSGLILMRLSFICGHVSPQPGRVFMSMLESWHC